MELHNMGNLSDSDYFELLSGDKLSVSSTRISDNTHGHRALPNARCRTILIGMGGTGIQTINQIKKYVLTQMAPGWRNYVAFLGIDASWTEFDSAIYLDHSECVIITKPGVEMRMANAFTYPAAVRRFMPERVDLGNLSSDGGGRTRLVGKVKFHDMDLETGKAVDVEIVNKLAYGKNTLQPLTPGEKYQVYVIGSVCGTTCGSCFPEMPALIRKALGNKVNIHAMLYLPDTFPYTDPSFRHRINAYGYATLKELNYYQGISMRTGYCEHWSYNGPDEPLLSLNSGQDFFTAPFLLGAPGESRQGNLKEAMNTVATFICSLLRNRDFCDYTDRLYRTCAVVHSNNKFYSPIHPGLEAPGELHEFPKRFGSISCARAHVPEDIVQAYVIDHICTAAGLRSVDAATRASMIAKGAEILPFLGKDEWMTAAEGTEKAAELLKPVLDFLKHNHTFEFNFLTEMQVEKITFDDIRKNRYTFNQNQAIESYVSSKTGQKMRDDLDQKLKQVFENFRENVKTYVMHYGPMSFWYLYVGAFIPENGKEGVGIRDMLANLVKNRHPERSTECGWYPADIVKDEIDRRYKEICDANVLNPFLPRQRMANDWLAAVDIWVNHRVNEKRREHVVGTYHALDQIIARPAAILADNLYAFSRILDQLSDIYHRHGRMMRDYNRFSSVIGSAEVNIAALNPEAYDCLKEHADRVASQINAPKVRDILINSFFDNPREWLAVPDYNLILRDSHARLKDPDLPIPAREMFDEIMRDAIGNASISIAVMFNGCLQRNISYNQYANMIISQLLEKSAPLIDAAIPASSIYYHVTCPQSLQNNPHSIIGMAIRQAVAQLIPGAAFSFSDQTDRITIHRLAIPFEIYRLNALKSWEKDYESLMAFRPYCLHGKSPDVHATECPSGAIQYTEEYTWHDYPSIVCNPDPTQKDPVTHLLPHEGRIRLEIDKLLDEARALGILYSKVDTYGKWMFLRIYCDPSRDWVINAGQLHAAQPADQLPTGEELASAIAAQNGISAKEITRAVRLEYGGLMSVGHDTEERAWFYAKRVLYAHRPMLIEIRETVKLFRKWYGTQA